jgi:hypothetical protein
VVTTLALVLGIGLTTAVFTTCKAVVIRPLDARAANDMVNLALSRDPAASQ